MLKYKAQEYIVLIKFSQNKHLLVEGRDDKKFFTRLIDEFKGHHPRTNKLHKPNIDSAENLVDFGVELGNREKVEYIHNKLDERDLDKLVAFVDREFREFEIGETVQDLLSNHKVNKKLVWSRGHSIENYFFDLEVLGELFRDHTPVDWFDRVTTMFDEVIGATLKIACTLSLLGYEINQFDFIRRSIDWQLIDISVPNVNLYLDRWQDELSKKSKFSSTEINSLLNRYNFWREKLETVELNTLKWLCHGHIGMTVVWAVYIRCICNAFPTYETSKPENLVSRVRGIGEEVRFQALTGCLARKVFQEKCEYPREVIELLGFLVS